MVGPDLSRRPTSSFRLNHFHFGNNCRALDHVIGDTLRSTPVCHSPPSPLVQGEGCFRRMRESSLVLIVCPLLRRRQCRQRDEVLFVGGLTHENDSLLVHGLCHKQL